MSQTGQDPQEDEGCLISLVKLIFGIVILVGGWWAIYWGVNNGPEFIAELREEGLTWTERFTATTTDEEPDDKESSTPITVPTNIDKMENADWLRSRHGGTYKTIKNLRWVKDGLTGEEAKTAQNLIHMAANDHETLERVLALQWTEDHITPSESKAIQQLMYLSYRDKEATRKIAEMPFLESVTEADALLIDGLHGRWHRGTLSGFMNHPAVADGITDNETVFAVAATIIDDNSQLGRVLNPGSATVETIQTASSRTPNLSISIVRAGTRKVTDSSKTVEEAVKYVEEEMGLPLPTNHVIVLLDDTGVIADFAGVNYGQAIAYLRKGEDGTDWDRAAFRKGMVHEVAHYFWRGSEDWIDEGMSNTIEYGFGRDQGLPMDLITTKQKTCTVTTLQELSRLDPGHESPQFHCNYYLGEKLFFELQQSKGKKKFQEGSRELYKMALALDEDDETAGIEEVRKAFGEESPVITKHWTGQKPPAPVVRTTGTPVIPIPTSLTIPVIPKVPPTPTPTKQPTVEPENRSGTQTPMPTATKRPTGPTVTNRFLELRYDASKTINNRQLPPASNNCNGGSRQLTRWSRTLNVEDQKAYIQDAKGNALQIKELHFAQVHPGRSYADSECPRDQFPASATVINLSNEAPPDLTGYIAEWQDENGNLIGSRLAQDGIAITLAHDDEPEDLYDRPARLLIYDQHTPGAKPTPAPVPAIRPEEKELVIEINPSLWEGNGNNRTSPDLTEEGHEIRDSKGKLWRIASIRTFDRTSRIGSTDYTSTEITVDLRNMSRARADFTGFNIQARELDGAPAGAGYWMPPAGRQPIGQAQITSGLSENFLRAVTIRIWDSYEPSLKSPTGRIPTPIPTPAPTPIPAPVLIPTPTPIPAPVLELFDNPAWKEYTVLFPTGWTVQPRLELTTFTSPDGRQAMEIGRHPVQHSGSISGFADEYRQELLKQAPGWDHFTEKSVRGEFIPAGNAVIATFDRRKTPESCMEDGITYLLRSRFFPKRSMGYSVTVTLCQEDLQKWKEIRSQMMESFTEKLTEE